MNINKLQQQLQTAILNQDWHAALTNIEQLAQLLPAAASLSYNKGLIHKKLEQFEAALKCFKQALELDQKHQNALFELASCEMELSEFELARLHLSQYLETNPSDTDAMLNLGNVLVKIGEPQQGLGWLQQANQLNPGATFTIQSLALAYRECGELDKCRELLDTLGINDPELAAARLKILTQGCKGRFNIRVADYFSAR